MIMRPNLTEHQRGQYRTLESMSTTFAEAWYHAIQIRDGTSKLPYKQKPPRERALGSDNLVALLGKIPPYPAEFTARGLIGPKGSKSKLDETLQNLYRLKHHGIIERIGKQSRHYLWRRSAPTR